MNCIALDVCDREPGVVIIEPMPCDEISYHPTSTLAVVVEVHKALRRDYGWTTDYDSIVTFASVVIIVLLDGHGVQERLYRGFRRGVETVQQRRVSEGPRPSCDWS